MKKVSGPLLGGPETFFISYKTGFCPCVSAFLLTAWDAA